MIVGGGIGGAIGAAIWGAVIYFTNYEVGYIAWLVGVLVGLGVRIGAAQGADGWGPGVTSAIIAVAALIGGKLFGVQLLLMKLRDMPGADQIGMIDALQATMSPIDLLWFVLAVSSAFRIGSGLSSE